MKNSRNFQLDNLLTGVCSTCLKIRNEASISGPVAELKEVRVVTRFALSNGPDPAPRATNAAASVPDFSKRRSAFKPAAFFFVVSQGGHHG